MSHTSEPDLMHLFCFSLSFHTDVQMCKVTNEGVLLLWKRRQEASPVVHGEASELPCRSTSRTRSSRTRGGSWTSRGWREDGSCSWTRWAWRFTGSSTRYRATFSPTGSSAAAGADFRCGDLGSGAIGGFSALFSKINSLFRFNVMNNQSFVFL